MIFSFFQKVFPTNLTYRNFIFIPAFFAFYISYQFFGHASFPLYNFVGRSISFATSEAVDIQHRVSIFYRGIFFALILLILFTRLTVVLRIFVTEEELKIANGLSLAGFCLLIFQLLGADMKPTFHLVFSCMLICLSGFIYHQTRKRDDRNFTAVFLWVIIVATCSFFFIRQVSLFIGIKYFLSLPVVIVGAGIPLYIWFTGHSSISEKWIRSSRPLIFIPLLSFISTELFMILNQHGILFRPGIIYSLGVIILFVRCLVLFRKSSETGLYSLTTKQLFNRWIPWLLVGFGCVAFYNPVLRPDIDWYESANNILPLQQWFSFGKVPFLDMYSSHALSDFGYGLIYAIFNGADPMGVYIYHFLIDVAIILIFYYFILKITSDGFLAIWMVLAYPYIDLLIPIYYNLVPLAVIAFVMLYEKQSVGRYVFFFATVFFMPLWRIDLGLSTIIAGIICLAIMILLVPSFKVERRMLVKGLTIIISIFVVLIIVAFSISGKHLIISLKDAVAYMSSFQSYGGYMSFNLDMKYYSLYFIMPAVVLMILLHTIYELFRNRDKPDNDRSILFSLAIIFLAVFYLSNLQRGLVRHTLAEGWDAAFSSFGFLIISSLVLMKYMNRNPFMKFFVFFIVSTVVVSNYVYSTPDLKKSNYYNYFNQRIKEQVAIVPTREKIDRTIENPEYYKQYKEFSDWMNKTFSPRSTYLDFSNSPMLYYYTQREVPNYFTQIPQTAHNDYLQDRFIDDLKDYDIPVTLFSNIPQNFWDNLDGIPNTFRHYKISEYIYRNYKPGLILNKHSVWLKKNFRLLKENEFTTVTAGEMVLKNVSDNESHSYWANADGASMNFTFASPIQYSNKKIYLLFHATANRSGELSLFYKSSIRDFNDKQKSVFKVNEGVNEIFVMAEPVENDKDLASISLRFAQGIEFSFSEIKIFVSDVVPDFASLQPANYHLKWIPYIWGAFDKNYTSNKIQLEKNIFHDSKILESNQPFKINFEPLEDKSNGNYIKLTARVPAGQVVGVILSYGEADRTNGIFNFGLKDDTLFHDYLIRISSQYLWYSRNNSWLSIYPENNTIEIREAAILKGD